MKREKSGSCGGGALGMSLSADDCQSVIKMENAGYSIKKGGGVGPDGAGKNGSLQIKV